jgi:hypothetical protein
LEYRRLDTLLLRGDSGLYIAAYDSSNGVIPKIFLPSTSLCAGIHFGIGRMHTAYGIGFQWEDIIFYDIRNYTGARVDIRFNTDWWFHQVRMWFDILEKEFVIPSIYFSARVPFGKERYTRWRMLEWGCELRIDSR